MLKAAIIYPMGSGGNFLTRLLTLSEKTIPMIKHELIHVDQVATEMTAQERFDLYNHFDITDWRTSEFSVIMQYKWGQRDFYEYEQSTRFLIDNWHPHVFLTEDDRGVLWVENTWQHIIFIDGDLEDRQFFNDMKIKKDYPPNTSAMYQSQHMLRETYADRAIDLSFKCLINDQDFPVWLKKINQQLDLELDLNLALKLWKSWLTHSKQCWNETTIFDRKNIYGDIWEPKIIKK